MNFDTPPFFRFENDAGRRLPDLGRFGAGAAAGAAAAAAKRGTVGGRRARKKAKKKR